MELEDKKILAEWLGYKWSQGLKSAFGEPSEFRGVISVGPNWNVTGRLYKIFNKLSWNQKIELFKRLDIWTTSDIVPYPIAVNKAINLFMSSPTKCCQTIIEVIKEDQG